MLYSHILTESSFPQLISTNKRITEYFKCNCEIFMTIYLKLKFKMCLYVEVLPPPSTLQFNTVPIYMIYIKSLLNMKT